MTNIATFASSVNVMNNVGTKKCHEQRSAFGGVKLSDGTSEIEIAQSKSIRLLVQTSSSPVARGISSNLRDLVSLGCSVTGASGSCRQSGRSQHDVRVGSGPPKFVLFPRRRKWLEEAGCDCVAVTFYCASIGIQGTFRSHGLTKLRVFCSCHMRDELRLQVASESTGEKGMLS